MAPVAFPDAPVARYGLVRYHEGSELESLTVGNLTYHGVVVRSVTARTIMITHARGMASVRLRDLSPELQVAFGYDPAAEEAANTAQRRVEAERQAQQAAARAREAAPSVAPKPGARFERMLWQFGQVAPLRPRVDLGSQFRALELHAKDQGRRPSCAVFAVVSALEYL